MEGVDFRAELRGRLDGRILDAQGRPVLGAEVTAELPGFPFPQGGVTTSSDGLFALPDLWAGPIRITATAPGVGTATFDLRVVPGGTTWREMTLR